MFTINTKKRVLQAFLSKDKSKSLQLILKEYLTWKTRSEDRTWGQACDKIGDLELYLTEPDNLAQLVAADISYETLSKEFVAFRKANHIPRSELFTPGFSTPLTQLSPIERGRLLGYSSRKVIPPPTRAKPPLPAYEETESESVLPGYGKDD